ncbi:response regulator [Shewanella sp. 10N.286.45.A1]|uniref:response regulator n=1 Tax=Shewanella sp. 10N.286.45.A1 TaxID=3229694 RepID=UPI00354D825A
MPNNPIKLYEHFYSILQEQSFDNFTLSELRNTYISRVKSNRSADSAYNLIYRQVRLLENNGLLTKHKKAKGKSDLYKKTKNFIEVGFCLITDKVSKSEQPFIELCSISSNLNERLKKLEIDLLQSTGESEEYVRLCKTFPEMKEHLDSQNTLAKQSCSKLLGQIKAIKTTQAYQSKSTQSLDSNCE